jgi:hypothetical protein
MANTYKVSMRDSAATTTAKTEVGDWIDVGDYNEAYVWLNVTAFASVADETLTVTLEREAGNTAGYSTIATFKVISTSTEGDYGPGSEELTLDFELGGRVRYRAVTAGTWSSKSITYNIQMYAKSA